MKKSTAAVLLFVAAGIFLIVGLVDNSIWAYATAALLVLCGVGMAILGRSSSDDT